MPQWMHLLISTPCSPQGKLIWLQRTCLQPDTLIRHPVYELWAISAQTNYRLFAEVLKIIIRSGELQLNVCLSKLDRILIWCNLHNLLPVFACSLQVYICMNTFDYPSKRLPVTQSQQIDPLQLFRKSNVDMVTLKQLSFQSEKQSQSFSKSSICCYIYTTLDNTYSTCYFHNSLSFTVHSRILNGWNSFHICYCIVIIFNYQPVPVLLLLLLLFSQSSFSPAFIPVIVSFSAIMFPCDVSVFMFGSEPTCTPESTSDHASGDFVFLGFGNLPSFSFIRFSG